MKAANFKVEDLVENLQGTCKSIQEALNDLYDDMDEADLTKADHEKIDAEIYRCETCSWWYEVGDKDADGNCENCSTSGEEDDEEYD